MNWIKQHWYWIVGAFVVLYFLRARAGASGYPAGATIGNPNNAFLDFGFSGLGQTAAVSPQADPNKVQALQSQIQGFRDGIANATAGYARDHFGGQSPAQFQAYIDGLTAKMNAAQAKLQDYLNGLGTGV